MNTRSNSTQFQSHQQKSSFAFSSDSSTKIATFRAEIEQEFSGLQRQQPRLLHLALNEAEAIAWQTGFPLLVYPELAAEKAQAVSAWDAHQAVVRRNSSELAFAV